MNQFLTDPSDRRQALIDRGILPNPNDKVTVSTMDGQTTEVALEQAKYDASWHITRTGKLQRQLLFRHGTSEPAAAAGFKAGDELFGIPEEHENPPIIAAALLPDFLAYIERGNIDSIKEGNIYFVPCHLLLECRKEPPIPAAHLTVLCDMQEKAIRHFLDMAALSKALIASGNLGKYVDLNAGAGTFLLSMNPWGADVVFAPLGADVVFDQVAWRLLLTPVQTELSRLAREHYGVLTPDEHDDY